MTNVCRFCKTGIQTTDQTEHVCADCKIEIKNLIETDEKLRMEFLENVLKDELGIERLAKAVFNVPVRSIGIGGEGNLAEFFRTRKRSNSTR